ncbi:MAG: protocatechuate 3,4-dioxygenase subunit alpha [Pseudomonadota bacterium]
MTTSTKLNQTPSQTVGPYFAYGLTPTQYGYDLKSLFTPVLAKPNARGEHIRITGQVIDGAGKPILDAMVEISQPDASGKPVVSLADAEANGFTGFGRCGTGTDPQNFFEFKTVKPGAAAAGQAPFINVCVTMRGLLVHTFTRIYFDDQTAANEQDAVLNSVPTDRRATLIARREELDSGAVYHFSIFMQGEQETVFFDL